MAYTVSVPVDLVKFPWLATAPGLLLIEKMPEMAGAQYSVSACLKLSIVMPVEPVPSPEWPLGQISQYGNSSTAPVLA
jgi:hypothetical protein